MSRYGNAPMLVGAFDPDWHEVMRYLYLPVVMPNEDDARLPERLEFMRPLVDAVLVEEYEEGMDGRYVYVTAHRGYATPSNPLNRPGWHADGFGTDDVNYVWSDRFPTRFATGDFGEISDDHIVSAAQFDTRVACADMFGIDTWEGQPNALYRLDDTVVHASPVVPAPGGERGFIKISVSHDRYNLRGNSHNYLFDYDWPMWTRAEMRNSPSYAGRDSGPQA